MIVLDASVAFAFLFPDEASDLADNAFEELRTVPAIVPSHWHAEMANGFLMAVRRGRMSSSFRQGAIDRIALIDIRVDDTIRDTMLTEGIALADRHDLTYYNAAYVQLAKYHRCILATLDNRLASAAIAEGVSVFGQTG